MTWILSILPFVAILGSFLVHILWTETYFRYWDAWAPIRFIHDFVWNLRNSRENHGHWVRSNRFGGQCKRCKSHAFGGMNITIFTFTNTGYVILSCKDIQNAEMVKQITEM